MKKSVILLVTLAAMGLLFTQASARQGNSQTGYGGSTPTANRAQGAANGNIAQLKAQISSIQAELSRELAKENVNMDKVRQLNQQMARKQQKLRSMATQRGGTYRRGTGGNGAYMGNMRGRGVMRGRGGMRGRRPCW